MRFHCSTRWIYILIDPRDGQVHYVGLTKVPLQRAADHSCDTKEATPKCQWVAGLRRAGLTPIMALIDRVPKDEAWQAERHWIRHFQALGAPLTNKEALSVLH